MNNLKDIHNEMLPHRTEPMLFYQDFNEQFEGYTQLSKCYSESGQGCFIRISMNNLKDIHNSEHDLQCQFVVVLSGFQ